MKSSRKKLSQPLETAVLTRSRRRCCLCVFLRGNEEVKKGQIAHLNSDSSDNRFENLIFLCLEHHDEFDSPSSQSKGLTEGELRHWRDQLIRKFEGPDAKWDEESGQHFQTPKALGNDNTSKSRKRAIAVLSRPWRYPLWQIADQPAFFAYSASNGCDGVCLIERIDLPDGRVVIACIQVPGNPGQSITNSVEEICTQVCKRFDIPPDRLVWLEHYEGYDLPDEVPEWNLVSFGKISSGYRFCEPRWTVMTPELWNNLRLKPRASLRSRYGSLQSKLRKLFPWPPQDR